MGIVDKRETVKNHSNLAYLRFHLIGGTKDKEKLVKDPVKEVCPA